MVEMCVFSLKMHLQFRLEKSLTSHTSSCDQESPTEPTDQFD